MDSTPNTYSVDVSFGNGAYTRVFCGDSKATWQGAVGFVWSDYTTADSGISDSLFS